MYAYPWDLIDHGLERAADELTELGIDAVQLSFSYHVATFLNPRNSSRKVRFGEPGVLEFQPASTVSEAWPFQPPVAAEVTDEHHLVALVQRLGNNGLAVLAWVVYLYSHSLAKQRPELAVENAFGDRHGAQLCPANPAVREYVQSLTRAVLAHQGLSGFVAESLSFLTYDYGFLNLKSAVVPSSAAARLLSLCFCRHCSSRATGADIDVDALRRSAVSLIGGELAELPDGARLNERTTDCQRWWHESTALRSYLQVREQIASSLQQDVLDAALSSGLRTGTNAAEAQDPLITGIPNESIASRRSDFRFELFPDTPAAELRLSVERAREKAGANATIYALAQLSNFPDEGAFRTALESVAALGVGHFRLYEYGLLSERQLAWLRNAREIWSAPVDNSTHAETRKDGS